MRAPDEFRRGGTRARPVLPRLTHRGAVPSVASSRTRPERTSVPKSSSKNQDGDLGAMFDQPPEFFRDRLERDSAGTHVNVMSKQNDSVRVVHARAVPCTLEPSR